MLFFDYTHFSVFKTAGKSKPLDAWIHTLCVDTNVCTFVMLNMNWDKSLLISWRCSRGNCLSERLLGDVIKAVRIFVTRTAGQATPKWCQEFSSLSLHLLPPPPPKSDREQENKVKKFLPNCLTLTHTQFPSCCLPSAWEPSRQCQNQERS